MATLIELLGGGEHGVLQFGSGVGQQVAHGVGGQRRHAEQIGQQRMDDAGAVAFPE